MSASVLSDPASSVRPEDVRPIDPHALVHFVTACQVAGVSMTGLGTSDHLPPPFDQSFRCLIRRLAQLSIPDAVKFLRKESP